MRETPILEFSKKDLNYIHNPLNKEDKIYIRSLKASFFINNKDFMNLLDFKVKKY
jgi:hypothetical protein